jgi:hypothetical protein
MIASEEHDNQPRIEVITCEGTRTEEDVMKNGKGIVKWIRK